MPKARLYSDAARRTADQYNLHRLADPLGNIGKWFAVALADGRGDNTLYDTRAECIRHQHNDETYYAYVQIVPSTMTDREAETFLTVQRKLYDNHMRVIDPDAPGGGPELIPRMAREDQASQIRRLFGSPERPRNLLIPGRDF